MVLLFIIVCIAWMNIGAEVLTAEGKMITQLHLVFKGVQQENELLSFAHKFVSYHQFRAYSLLNQSLIDISVSSSLTHSESGFSRE